MERRGGPAARLETWVVLCTLAAGVLGVQQDTFTRTRDLDDVLPSTDSLFHKAQASRQGCARVCGRHPDCFGIAVTGDRIGSCYGYSSLASEHPNGVTVDGAKSYTLTDTNGPKQCQVMMRSVQSRGITQVSADPKNLCDGKWLVFQRRQTGVVDFYRDWDDYKHGFGNSTEHWLGLEAVRELTSQGRWTLRVDLRDRDGNSSHVTFSDFSLGPEASFYPLRFDNFTGGPAGDSLTYHHGLPFSTKDADHDLSNHNCATRCLGAWWYKACHQSNLNGDYNNDNAANGVNWQSWRGKSYSLPYTRMKMQKV